MIDYEHYDSQISSVASAKVKSIPHASDFKIPAVLSAVSGHVLIQTGTLGFQATTRVNPTDIRLPGRGIPWWLYLLAILAGLTLLILLVLLLWRVGVV